MYRDYTGLTKVLKIRNYVIYVKFSFIWQLPDHVMDEVGEGSGIPEIVAELDYFSVSADADDELCLENLKVFFVTVECIIYKSVSN